MDISAELWRGVVVPKGTPPRVVARLEDAVRKTVANPDFARATGKLLVAPAFLPAAEFGKAIAREDAEIARTVKALGIRQDSKSPSPRREERARPAPPPSGRRSRQAVSDRAAANHRREPERGRRARLPA
jgi:hypothetical protein